MPQANQEQQRYWNEEGGARWVLRQEQLDGQVAPFGAAAMERAAVRPGERVLDVGCGCGQTTWTLASLVGPAGSVLGVDLSEPMLARARTRGPAGASNGRFERADAQSHPFARASVDLIFSRFGVMFFDDPVRAFSNLRTALAPSGRLCFVCWQPLQKNPWAAIPLAAALEHLPPPPAPPPGAPGPFAFADPARVREILSSAGFVGVQLEGVERRVTAGGASNAADAAAFSLEIGPVARLMKDADAPLRSRVALAVETALAPQVTPGGVLLQGAAWIVTAH